jgi:hypothetical protein
MLKQEEQFKNKIPVAIRKDYIMYLEWFGGVHWFHVDVFKWTPAIKVKFLDDLNLLSCLVKNPLYAFGETTNHKLVKFGELLGWEHHKTITLDNNTEAYIYKWSK